MPNNKVFGIGVIGLFMGKCALSIHGHNEFFSEIRAICDIDETRLMKASKEFNVPLATTDYRVLIESKDVDIVAIFSPDHLHMEMIRAALKAGKHVICTKPMVTSLDDAVEVVELVKKYHVKFLVGQTRRFVKHHIEAKELYESGAIGKPLFAEASYVHGDIWKVFDRGDWRYLAPQDMIYGAAVHPIDHLRWYFGDVEEVFAYGSESSVDLRYPQNRKMNYLINLKFKNGLIARVLSATGIVEQPYGSTNDIYPGEGFSVFGTNGTITNRHARYFIEGDRRKPAIVDFSKEQDVIDFDGKEYTGHTASVFKYIREMEECIIQDRPAKINEIEGAKAISTCYACEQSIITGTPVAVFNDF